MGQIIKSKYDNIIYKVKDQYKEKVSMLVFFICCEKYEQK